MTKMNRTDFFIRLIVKCLYSKFIIQSFKIDVK